jgi:hypothetical protein
MPFPPQKKTKANPMFTNEKAASLSAASPQNPNQKLRPKKKMNAPPRGLGPMDKGGASNFAKLFMKR